MLRELGLTDCSSMMSPLAPSPCATPPQTGDRILIFKPQWLALVLSGRKTLEVRGVAYKSGSYYLGHATCCVCACVCVCVCTGLITRVCVICPQLSPVLSRRMPGTGGVIYAQAHLGRALRVENVRHFRRHQDKHRVFTTGGLPYKKTYMIPIISLRKIKRPYVHPRGAIGTVPNSEVRDIRFFCISNTKHTKLTHFQMLLSRPTDQTKTWGLRADDDVCIARSNNILIEIRNFMLRSAS